MPLKLIVDTLDGVPEALQGEYAKGEDGKFHLGVEGIEDTTGLKKSLKSERDARAAFEKQLKLYEGIDPEAARELLHRFENDEDLQLIKKGDTTKLREKWTEKMRADYEKKLTAEADKVKAEGQKAQRWRERVMDNAVREAATRVGIHSHAVEDALYRARSIFSLDEEGNAVQIRDGSPVLGKDGKTPFSPAEWLESMREVAPHWFPATASGSGAQQGKGGGSGSNGQRRTIQRSAFDGMPPHERSAYLKSGGGIIDDPH